MKAQLLFHIKSLIVQANSRVGCTRQLLNCDEETPVAVIPHESLEISIKDGEIFHWLSLFHFSESCFHTLPFSFWPVFYLHRELSYVAFATDVEQTCII